MSKLLIGFELGGEGGAIAFHCNGAIATDTKRAAQFLTLAAP